MNMISKKMILNNIEYKLYSLYTTHYMPLSGVVLFILNVLLINFAGFMPRI